jgi:membrane protease YdiL (CAAX protease family)
MDVRFKRESIQLPAALSIIIPFGMIAIGEALLFNGNLEGSAAAHALNILLSILIPILLKQNPLIWQAFSLVSLMRVLNLAMPTFHELTLLWMPLIYGPILLVGFLMVRDETKRPLEYVYDLARFFRISPSATGWKLYYLPFALIVAVVAANIEFIVLSQTITDLRLIPELSPEYLALLMMVMVFFVGLGEEVVFRYILQTRLQAMVGIGASLIITSLTFAFMHSGYTSLVYVAYVFGISMMLGLLYNKTKSLALVALIHGTLNFLLFSFLPFGQLLLF